MGNHIIFTPDREASRDLTYSERSSCRRSIHVLLQDKGLEKYAFLLKAYRSIISSYLSFDKIENPGNFLRILAAALDDLSHQFELYGDELKHLGIYVLICSSRCFWLLSSGPGGIIVGVNREYKPLNQLDRLSFAEIPLAEQESKQQELFPEKLKDLFRIYSVEIPHDEPLEVILGCNESEKSAVLAYLREHCVFRKDRLESKSGHIPLQSLTSRVLALEFSAAGAESDNGIHSAVPLEQAGASHLSVPAVVLYVALITAILVGGFYGVRKLFFSKKTEPPRAGKLDVTALAPSPSTGAAAEKALRSSSAVDISIIKFNLVWKRDFSKPVTSSPKINGDLVLFGCRDGTFYALDMMSGETRWKYNSKAGIGSSPAIFGDKVVCANYHGDVFCLNAADGNVQWTQRLPGKISSSPLLVSKKVVVGCYDGYVYCLAAGSGEILWKYKTGGLVRASPQAASETVLVPSHDGNLYALTLGTGKVLWRYNMREGLESSPAVLDSQVVIGTGDGFVTAFGISSGRKMWQTKVGAAVKSTLAANGTRVYAGANDNYLYCIDSITGAVLWKYGTGDIILAKSGISGNATFFGSYDGNLYVLDSRTGDKIDSFKTGDQIFSSPALAGGHVFFGTIGTNGGKLYCLQYYKRETS